MADADDVDQVWDEWKDAVNLAAKELTSWLETPASRAAGDRSGRGESTGHESGRRIVEILHTRKADLSDDDVRHMQKVVGYVHPPPGAAAVR